MKACNFSTFSNVRLYSVPLTLSFKEFQKTITILLSATVMYYFTKKTLFDTRIHKPVELYNDITVQVFPWDILYTQISLNRFSLSLQ